MQWQIAGLYARCAKELKQLMPNRTLAETSPDPSLLEVMLVLGMLLKSLHPLRFPAGALSQSHPILGWAAGLRASVLP